MQVANQFAMDGSNALLYSVRALYVHEILWSGGRDQYPFRGRTAPGDAQEGAANISHSQFNC